MSISYSTPAIVLKRKNYREADRIVTLYTKDLGKITVLAKGVRKTSSRNKGGLEPGTKSQCQLIKGKTFLIVAQVKILHSFVKGKLSLPRLTQTFQLLEIIDNLTAEDEANPELYEILTESLCRLEENGLKRSEMIGYISKILFVLGFGPPDNLNESALKNYIEELANKNLKTKDFLTNIY